MTRPRLIVLHLANLAVSVTGLVYGWMRYMVTPTDEWAVVNHPLQPLLQHLHVLAAPLLVFAVGLIWIGHVATRLGNGSSSRAAGVVLTILFLPMVASGYLLQVAVEPDWRQRWIWVHVAASLLWIVSFVAHQVRAFVAEDRPHSGTEASASVITVVQFGSSSEDPGGEAGTGRQRIRRSSSGTNPPNNADSTSLAVGGDE